MGKIGTNRTATYSCCRASLQHLPVQVPVLDRFGDVAFFDFFGVIEIGKGAGDAQHLVVSPRAEAEAVDRILEKRLRARREHAEFSRGCRVEMCVAREGSAVTHALLVANALHRFAYRRAARLALAGARDLVVTKCRYFYV